MNTKTTIKSTKPTTTTTDTVPMATSGRKRALFRLLSSYNVFCKNSRNRIEIEKVKKMHNYRICLKFIFKS